MRSGGMRGRWTAAGLGCVLLVALTACDPAATGSRSVTASPTRADVSPAVTGDTCPQVIDTSKADFFPIQPSFSAGYEIAAQKLNGATKDWAYVLTGDFPYSNWMAWYLYTTDGVPLFKMSDYDILPDDGSTNPFVEGNAVLAEKRHYHLYFMPSDTPDDVVTSMQNEGKNVILLPAHGSSPGVSIVGRSYWSFSNDGLGDYDRFGYLGPTNTPLPVIAAYETDPSTGELTDTPVKDCGAQSQLPERLWYDPATNSPIVTFEDAPRPTERDLQDIPHYKLQAGSVSGTMGAEFPPSPNPDEVAFYRNVAANSPYADVQSAPPPGSPPDACGGYVMANLPNDVVSLVHIPQVPSFPSYVGADASTVNESSKYDVAFYSVVIYGETKQIDAVGSPDNSQIGNTQIAVNDDGSATIVAWPQSATPSQVRQIDAVVKANGWNILRSGLQSAIAPNLMVIREKGQNQQWKHALSVNDVTDGAPCPQSKNPSLPLPQDPPSAAVTQFNGMGLTAPQGQNCTIDEFLSGACLRALSDRLQQEGAVWSASSDAAPPQKKP